MAVHYGLKLALGGAPNNWHTVIAPDGTPLPGLYHPEYVTDLEEIGLSRNEAQQLAKRVDSVRVVEMPPRKRTEYREALRAAMHRGRNAARREVRGPRAGEADYLARVEHEATTAPSSVEVDPTPVVTGEADEPTRDEEADTP